MPFVDKEHTLEPHVVLKIEFSVPIAQYNDWRSTLEQALQDLRGVGAARVVGAEEFDHDPFDDKEWRDKMVDTITVHAPVTLVVD